MMLRRRSLILLACLSASHCAAQSSWQGTWAATAGTGGAAFAGTWSASPGGTAADSVTGTWALRDANGAELATGTWAAVKEGNLWKGSWQARRESGQIYNGTWTTQVGKAQQGLPANARLTALFEQALTHAVSGTWQMGSSARGAWTIRAYASQ